MVHWGRTALLTQSTGGEAGRRFSSARSEVFPHFQQAPVYAWSGTAPEGLFRLVHYASWAASPRRLSELTASRRTCILRHPLCRLCARLLSPVRGRRETRVADRALPCAFGDRTPRAPEQQAREREEDVSTEQAEAQEGARIPCPDAHACRPGSAQAQARQGSQATLGLTQSGSVSRPTLALGGLLPRLSRGTVCCQQVSGPILFRAL